MLFQLRCQPRALNIFLALLFLLISLPTWAAEKMRLQVDDYQIEAELSPHVHKITARTKAKFTPLANLNIATFDLNNGLRLTKMFDAAGNTLAAQPSTPDVNGACT